MERDLVFISYSHKDKRWLTKLETMLKPLTRRLEISVWNDTQINAGAQWEAEIKQALDRAKVAVLLVSPDFLASDYIYENELPPLLNAARQGGLTFVCLHISHCLFEYTDIRVYQAANDPSKPLDMLKPAEQNRILKEVCETIAALVSQKNREADDS